MENKTSFEDKVIDCICDFLNKKSSEMRAEFDNPKHKKDSPKKIIDTMKPIIESMQDAIDMYNSVMDAEEQAKVDHKARKKED